MGNYDLERIKSVIQRAQSGQELTIGFLGGSITAGKFGRRSMKILMHTECISGGVIHSHRQSSIM